MNEKIKIVPGFCVKDKYDAGETVFYVGSDLKDPECWFVLVLDDYFGLRLKTVFHELDTQRFLYWGFEIIS